MIKFTKREVYTWTEEETIEKLSNLIQTKRFFPYRNEKCNVCRLYCLHQKCSKCKNYNIQLFC